MDSEFNNNYDTNLRDSSINRNSFDTSKGVNSIIYKQSNSAITDLKDPKFIIVKRSEENGQENVHLKRNFKVSKGSCKMHGQKI